jgi:hypothetical protein
MAFSAGRAEADSSLDVKAALDLTDLGRRKYWAAPRFFATAAPRLKPVNPKTAGRSETNN